MIDTDKYEGRREAGLFNTLGCIDFDVVDNLLAEVKRLREENHTLEMMAWEYENVWEWLMQNADYTCRKLLLLIEEWKEEDGLVTIDGMTYRKERIE